MFFLTAYSDADGICKEVSVDIIENADGRFISEQDIKSALQNAGKYPTGKKSEEINTEAIEETLMKNRLIKRAECYKTVSGNVKIKIYQRTPVLRIFTDRGSFFVDKEREIMPVPRNFAAYVPVANGNISDEYAKNQLYDFAKFLQGDKFWNSQIEQIFVEPNLDVEIIPSVGDHRIIIGKIENYPENLKKLQLFYDKGLKETGWTRYSVINLKFKNQVVCKLKNANQNL
jgi:cell division protein FtsQ